MPALGASGVKLHELIAGISEGGVRDQGGVYCTAKVASRSWRLHVEKGLRADDDVALVILTDTLMSRRILVARDLLAGISGGAAAQVRATDVHVRSVLVHRAMLQAIDGAAAGASQREIAVAIFGSREVLKRWTPDGDLRAKVRYFLRRGHTLVERDYRKLAYL